MKIRNRAKRSYQFLTSLSPDDIPPSTSLWIQGNYPRINKSVLETYSKHKRQERAGQQEKAYHLVLYVKVLKQDNVTFVKGMVKKSLGQISRPAILNFVDGTPSKGHCTCTDGLSGICCHILCVLHFLIHLIETGEKVVALTATQQLQKWHKKGAARQRIHNNASSPSAT